MPVLFILPLLAALLIIPIKLTVYIRYNGRLAARAGFYYLFFKLFGVCAGASWSGIILIYGHKIKKIDYFKKKHRTSHKEPSLLLRAMLRSLRPIRLETVVCTANAADTAMLCGLLRIIADIIRKVKYTHLKSIVIPDFDNTDMRFQVGCILLLRPADIIIKYIEGGIEKWKKQKNTVDIRSKRYSA